MKANRLKIKDGNEILGYMPNTTDNLLLLHRVFDVEFEGITQHFETYKIQ